MKTLESQMNVYFRLFTLIGQFPFKITENGLAPSNILKFFAIVPITPPAVSIAFIVKLGTMNFLGAREGILRLAFFCLGMSLISAPVIAPIWKSSLYCSAFQRFNKVEGYLRDLGIGIKKKKNIYPTFMIVFRHLLLLATILVSDYFFPYWVTMNLPIPAMIFYWTAVLIMTLVTINAATYAHLLNTRFDAINDELENMDKTMKSNRVLSMDKVGNKKVREV